MVEFGFLMRDFNPCSLWEFFRIDVRLILTLLPYICTDHRAVGATDLAAPFEDDIEEEEDLDVF